MFPRWYDGVALGTTTRRCVAFDRCARSGRAPLAQGDLRHHRLQSWVPPKTGRVPRGVLGLACTKIRVNASTSARSPWPTLHGRACRRFSASCRGPREPRGPRMRRRHSGDIAVQVCDEAVGLLAVRIRSRRPVGGSPVRVSDRAAMQGAHVRGNGYSRRQWEDVPDTAEGHVATTATL